MSEVRLVRFNDETGSPIHVNPAHVVTVAPWEGEGRVILILSNGGSVIVEPTTTSGPVGSQVGYVVGLLTR